MITAMKQCLTVSRICLLFLVGLIITQVLINNRTVNAQDKQNVPEAIKAAYILNFGKFVDWPPSSLEKSRDHFTLCVVGISQEQNVFSQTLKNQTVKERRIDIQMRPGTASLSDCQIVYISSDNPALVAQVLSRSKGTPILTVGDVSNFTQLGGIIQFKVEQEHLRFKINLNAANGAGLKISSKLLSLAEVVK